MNYYPYQNYGVYQQPTQQPTNNGLNWVSGEAGAKSWLMGRGETALLMDSEGETFYIKQTDQAGMPLPLRVFDYKERTNAPQPANNVFSMQDGGFVTREEYNEICAKYEELRGIIDELKGASA